MLKRALFVCLLSVPLLVKSQVPLDFTAIDNAQRLSFSRYAVSRDINPRGPKWQLIPFGGISARFGVYNSMNASMISAPMGVQLNRRLSRNVYAYAAISAAPAYMNFNSMFRTPDMNKFAPPYIMNGVNRFGGYSRAEAGLFYVNDDKTFSISGSIFLERSSYPAYYPYNPSPVHRQPANRKHQAL